jgi:hypothetical protein
MDLPPAFKFPTRPLCASVPLHFNKDEPITDPETAEGVPRAAAARRPGSRGEPKLEEAAITAQPWPVRTLGPFALTRGSLSARPALDRSGVEA